MEKYTSFILSVLLAVSFIISVATDVSALEFI